MSHSTNSHNINILKIVAFIMVVTIHVAAINFPKLGSVSWDISNIYNSFSRVCVPIFFMISGYFLISRNESTLRFYKRRMTKILPPLIFWSAVFYAYNHFYLRLPLYNPVDLLIRPASAHLWYLYAIIGLYLVMPFLSKIYINSSESERKIFIVIWLLTSSVIPTANGYFGLIISHGLFQLTSIYGYVGFLFIGAWIKDNPITNRRNLALPLFMTYLLLSCVTCILTKSFSESTGKPSQLFYNYLSPFVIVASVALFYFFTCLEIKSEKVKKVGTVFSSFALGVYCVHTLFIGFLAKTFRIGGDVNPTELYIAMTVVATFALSCIVSFVGSRIPLLKKVF